MRDPRLSEALPELQHLGLIDPEQADRIRTHYADEETTSGNRMVLLFGILGALLIGSGIILLVAHNWDQLGRTARTALAFLPLLAGQTMVLVAIRKGQEAVAWREAGSTFLLLAVGACLALVSQIYHLPGDLEGFLLTWALLVVLLLHVPGSVMATLLYIALITWYALLVRSGSGYNAVLPWLYWPLVAAAMPRYVQLWMRAGNSTSLAWMSLFMALSLGIVTNQFWRKEHLEMALGIAGMATAYCLLPILHHGKTMRTGAFPWLGRTSLLLVLFILSYRNTWQEGTRPWESLAPNAVLLAILVGLGIGAYAWSLRTHKAFSGDGLPETLFVLILAYAIARASPEVAALVVNGWLVWLGVRTVRQGQVSGSLRQLNLGLAILGTTVVLRFFDMQINNALKGLVFMALGILFLLLNIKLLKQRKTQPYA